MLCPPMIFSLSFCLFYGLVCFPGRTGRKGLSRPPVSSRDPPQNNGPFSPSTDLSHGCCRFSVIPRPSFYQWSSAYSVGILPLSRGRNYSPGYCSRSSFFLHTPGCRKPDRFRCSPSSENVLILPHRSDHIR